MSQLQVQILHQDYLLTCPEGRETQLMEAAERVDQQFQVMRDSSKLRSRERVGVLLAVNLAYENLELRNQLQTLQQELAALQGTTGATLTEADAARLQALEAQAVHDQSIAQHWLERIEKALQTSDAQTPVAPTIAPCATPAAEHPEEASAPAAQPQ